MQSVIRGNSINLDVRYEDGNGAIVDPTTPFADILDSAGGQVLMGVVPTRQLNGDYRYTFAVSLTALIGVWTINWYGTIGSYQVGPIPDYFLVNPIGAIVPVFSSHYTYDPSTDIGYIRLATDDRDLSQVDTLLPYEQRSAVFSDEEIQRVLDLSGDRNYAAATCLIFLANNRNLLVQMRKIGRTEVNFGAVRADLLKQAQALIDMANMTPAEGYAEHAWTDFDLRRIIINTQLRQGV